MEPSQNQPSVIYLFVSKSKLYVGPLDILIGKHHQLFQVCPRLSQTWGGLSEVVRTPLQSAGWDIPQEGLSESHLPLACTPC